MAEGATARSGHPANLEQLGYLLTGLFNATLTGLAVFDADTRVVLANPAFASAIANSSVSDCVGKSARELLGDAAADLESGIRTTLDTGKQLPAVDVVTRLAGADLVNHWLFNLLPIKDHADGQLKVAAITVETSHHKRIEEYFLVLMSDMSWLREQISKDPTVLQNRREVLRPMEETSLLETVSEEVRTVSAMLKGEVGSAREGTLPDVHSEPGIRDASSEVEVQKLATLSPREREVLCLVAASKGNKEIATILSIETRTVDTYRSRLMLKLDLHSTAAVVLYAVKHHLVSP
ncbi:MAG: LuxR C-terminal-related transcriptional regulator [Candidatus Acidiferrum sp.]